MILQSLLTLFLMAFISLIAMGVAISLLRKVPSREMILIVLCVFLELLAYASYSINNIFSTPTSIDENTLAFIGLGYFFSISAIMVITYTVILIDFKYSYSNIIEIIAFTWVSGVDSIYNSITFTTKLDNGTIETIYDPIGIIFIILFFGMVIFIWSKRFYQISKIYQRQEKFGNILRSLLIFILIGSLFISIYVISVVVFDYTGDSSFIMGGMFTFIGTIALLRNNAFLFITDIHLDSIIIIEKRSGMRLYSKDFNNHNNNNNNSANLNDDSDFIGSVISAINISFSSTIQSQKDLTELSFADKKVLIYTGSTVRSILIVSNTNLIAKSVSRHLVQKFEKKFGLEIKEKFKNNSFVNKKSDYIDFDQEVAYVRKFLPL